MLSIDVQLNCQNVYVTLLTAVLFLAVLLKHSSSQSTYVCGALEALERMCYIDQCFTLPAHFMCLMCLTVCLVYSPIATHYFPTLHHDRYELEDGYTAAGGAVRYGFDDRQFTDYSWRGYSVYSRLQVRPTLCDLHYSPACTWANCGKLF